MSTEQNVRSWGLLSTVLGLFLALMAYSFSGDISRFGIAANKFEFTVAAGLVPQVIATGLILLVLGVLAFVLRRRLAGLIDGMAAAAGGLAPLSRRHPYATLFIVSFVILFVEVMFIRYTSSQFRIFAFYKNIPLVSCFLGLGLGCFLRGGGPRHALLFIGWMIPLTVFLAQGSVLVNGMVNVLGALATSEFVIGDSLFDSDGTHLPSQLSIALFCGVALLSIAGLFSLLGRLLGSAFEEVPRLPGYTLNILGSLAGIVGFVGLSYLQTPPFAWYLVGLLPLLWWLSGRTRLGLAAVLAAVSALAVLPSHGETVWSPYQKLVGHQGQNSYVVQIADVFYQVAHDLSPAAVAERRERGLPSDRRYDDPYTMIPKPERVLIVGAGTGNDAAAALRNGASQVDAVDIDPAIVDMGRRHHPERPYDDPRVRVIVDDARSTFNKLPKGSYDAIFFGTLDSHTQLGMSSVRLDNYVFTLESFAAARRLLKPGGALVVSAVDRAEWLQSRFAAMLQTVCDTPVQRKRYYVSGTYVCTVSDPARPIVLPEATTGMELPRDDWPFLFLPTRSVPQAYIVVVLVLAALSVAFLQRGGLEFGRITPFHGHMFFMGAAFLLMEVYAINRLALLFGTTWLVSAIAIGTVLALIVLANLTVQLLSANIQTYAYLALFASLVAGYWIDPSAVLGKGSGLALGYAIFSLLPVYFAAIVFAQSFQVSSSPGPAIGANILGAVLGGWVEYATMATGIRSMALLALAFYLASLIALVISRRPSRRADLAGT